MSMEPKWLSNHLPYTISKYAMSMSVIGMSSKLHKHGIAVNALWPRIVIFTASTKMLFSDGFAARCRQPKIMSDAAHAILTLPSKNSENTGNFFLDESVLRANGVTNFDAYSCKPGGKLAIDLFLEEKPDQSTNSKPPATGSVNDVFKTLTAMMTPDLISEVNGSFSFDLTGSEPGLWFIDFKTPSGGLGKLSSKEEASKMDTHVTMDSADFVQLLMGSASPKDLLSAGKILVEGDVMSALRFVKRLPKK